MRLHNQTSKYTTQLLLLILISTVARAVLALTTELGNDEAYYRVLSLFTEHTNYDHPPMVAYLIQLTTLGSSSETLEWLVRLGPILIGAINTYLIYWIAKSPIFRSQRSFYYNSVLDKADYRRGYLAALLYTASIYCSVLVGTFIMPDTPLSLFWLITLLIFSRILPVGSRYNAASMLVAGVMIGLAILSKYSGAYLWGAAFLYIILFNRSILTKWSLYVSVLLTFAVLSPLIIWNYNNDFASIAMHTERISSGTSVNMLYFWRELAGSAAYNGLINFLLILTSLVAYYVLRRGYMPRGHMRFLLCFSLPMVLIFLVASLTRPTLPHWSAPAYYAFIVIAASYLSTISIRVSRFWIVSSLTLTALALTFGALQINYGVVDLSSSREVTDITYGTEDPSLDMYGWEQLEEKFAAIYHNDKELGIMPEGVIVAATNWFEASHIESYIGLKHGLKIITPLEQSYRNEFYANLSKSRVAEDFATTEPFYVLLSGKFLRSEVGTLALFGITEESPYEVIPIERGGELAINFILYRINPMDVQGSDLEPNLSELNTPASTIDSTNNQQITPQIQLQ